MSLSPASAAAPWVTIMLQGRDVLHAAAWPARLMGATVDGVSRCHTSVVPIETEYSAASDAGTVAEPSIR